MHKKLQIIIEEVLSHYIDANLLSEQARKQIAKEIVDLYTDDITSDELLKTANEEIV